MSAHSLKVDSKGAAPPSPPGSPRSTKLVTGMPAAVTCCGSFFATLLVIGVVAFAILSLTQALPPVIASTVLLCSVTLCTLWYLISTYRGARARGEPLPWLRIALTIAVCLAVIVVASLTLARICPTTLPLGIVSLSAPGAALLLLALQKSLREKASP